MISVSQDAFFPCSLCHAALSHQHMLGSRHTQALRSVQDCSLWYDSYQWSLFQHLYTLDVSWVWTMTSVVHQRTSGLSYWNWLAKALSNLRDLNWLHFGEITGLKVPSYNGRALKKISYFEKKISETWYWDMILFFMSVVGSCTVWHWFKEIIHSHSNGWLSVPQWGGSPLLFCLLPVGNWSDHSKNKNVSMLTLGFFVFLLYSTAAEMLASISGY